MQITGNLKNIMHGVYPILGAMRFGIPGNDMSIIGITGTDGKSSSVVLTATMLRAAGHTVAHFSSISYHDGIGEVPNDMKITTPGRMYLHRFLDRARKNGCTHAVIEITSQSVLQYRHHLIGFSLIAITNITPEHIEAHGSFERYQAAKIKLVDELISENRGVVIDEDTYQAVRSLLPKKVEIHPVKFDSLDGILRGTVAEGTPFTSTIVLSRGNEKILLRTQLGGPFAPRNILFAATIASLFGVGLAVIRDAVEKIDRIPGRFEIISSDPMIIVDYAHTLNALTQLLSYVRERTSGKLVHVFGAAGGGRDRYKRPLIAQLSERHADISILTEENSFDEPVRFILRDVRKGFSEAHTVHVIPKREDAVAFAHGLLLPGDTLLLTAKGSETVIAGPKREMRRYDERAYVKCLSETFLSA